MFSISTERLVRMGLGVTTKTYYLVMMFYPYGGDTGMSFVHTAVFGRN